MNYAFENFTRVEIPVEDTKVTRADILGVNYLGKARELECAALKEKTVEAVSSVKVSIPKDRGCWSGGADTGIGRNSVLLF